MRRQIKCDRCVELARKHLSQLIWRHTANAVHPCEKRSVRTDGAWRIGRGTRPGIRRMPCIRAKSGAFARMAHGELEEAQGQAYGECRASVRKAERSHGWRMANWKRHKARYTANAVHPCEKRSVRTDCAWRIRRSKKPCMRSQEKKHTKKKIRTCNSKVLSIRYQYEVLTA